MARLLAAAVLFAGLLALAQAQRQYYIVAGYDIPGNDIPSNGKPYTKVCIPSGSNYKGNYGHTAWEAWCNDTPGCVAAVAPAVADNCAYLKAKGTRDVAKPDPKWVVITSQQKISGGCAKFAADGERCNVDPWAEYTVCCGGNHVKCNNGVCGSTFPPSGPPPTPAPAPATVSGGRQWRYVTGHDIPGNDIPSNGQPYTKFCAPPGGYKGKIGSEAFKIACDATPRCVAFVMTSGAPDGCAYLKARGTRDTIKPNPAWVVMTSQVPPQKPCATYSPIGGRCTTDSWADVPVCCGGNHVKCQNGVCASGFPSGGRKLAM